MVVLFLARGKGDASRNAASQMFVHMDSGPSGSATHSRVTGIITQ